MLQRITYWEKGAPKKKKQIKWKRVCFCVYKWETFVPFSSSTIVHAFVCEEHKINLVKHISSDSLQHWLQSNLTALAGETTLTMSHCSKKSNAFCLQRTPAFARNCVCVAKRLFCNNGSSRNGTITFFKTDLQQTSSLSVKADVLKSSAAYENHYCAWIAASENDTQSWRSFQNRGDK